ncbi:MAG TPA: cytochrome C oxidase subunit IV family protein [Vicinamibacterales bacterium]|nr:cytochrome C oxidase subunit IV family protein [Vicinamibacterales bacterium]
MSEVIVPRKTYYVIFGILVVLTVVTTEVAFFDFGLLNPVIALTIAVLKATVVVLYFMHMKYSSRLTMIIGGAGVFWLGILLVLLMSDYLARGTGWY